MRRTVKARLMAGAVCLAMVAAACGGDGDGDGAIGGFGDDAVSAEGKPYAESLEKDLTTGGDGEIEVVSDEQAGCIAPKWVNTLKPDRLKEAGIEPPDLGIDQDADMLVLLELSSDEGSALVDAFSDCGVDLKETFLFSGTNLSDDAKNCLDDAFSDELAKEVLVLYFTKGPAGFEEDSDVNKEREKASDKCD